MPNHAADGPPAVRPAANPLRARRSFLGGLAIGVVAMSAVGLGTAAFIESPAQLAARSSAPPRSAITATVRWEVLRNAITTQGVVRSARTISVTARAPYATVTITRLPVKVGDRIRPGRVLAEVDGRPIFLLRGRLPAYRDLHEGDHGPDVVQLQGDLVHLGYADYDPPGYFLQSTALALLLFYRALGYDAPVYHPPARAAAARSAAGGGPGPGGPGPGGPGAGTDHAIASGQSVAGSQFPSAYLPMSEVSYVPTPTALVVAVGARVGKVVSAGPILMLATGRPYVTGALSAHQSSLVRKGMPARIVAALPRLVSAGIVTRAGSLPAVGGPPSSGFPIQVASRRPLPQHLIGVRVRLTIWSAVTSGPVLAVPVSAIRVAHARHGARRGTSDYVVTVAAGGHRDQVAIFTGPTADGLVAVQPVRRGALRAGDKVLIGLHR